MATTTTTRSRPTAPAGRMRPRTRKAVLIAHVIASVGWIGADVVLGTLVVTALSTSDPALADLCVRVLPLFVGPILTLGLAALVTGVVLGLGTHLGLVRYWWVAVKIVVTTVLLLLVLFLLRPGLGDAADAVTRGDAPPDTNALIMPPLVSGPALVFLTVISVHRPWGRIRRRRRRPRPPRLSPAYRPRCLRRGSRDARVGPVVRRFGEHQQPGRRCTRHAPLPAWTEADSSTT